MVVTKEVKLYGRCHSGKWKREEDGEGVKKRQSV